MVPTLPLFAVPFILAFGGLFDAISLCFFVLIRNWAVVNLYVDIAVVIGLAKGAAAIFALLQILRYVRGSKESSSSSDGFPAKPMIFPCRTSHTRLFPKTHSFSYSYLWVGVPVGWKGSVGGMLSSDAPAMPPSSWYTRLWSLKPTGAWHTVNGDDYLGRGHVDGGLQEKLRSYLESQGIDPKEYPYAYLLTAPRFLGYVSNPVSIWNLYSPSKELKAFILEVNNTFDERHIYFVKPELVPSTSPDPDVPPKLVNTWPKDFYVSTFNSRAGNYTISATDPLFPSMSSPGSVNTSIKLKSPHVSLEARIYSSGPPLDPTTMSLSFKTQFLISWWWVGLATFPRTIVQALNLLLKRKMPWVFRPEPRRNTMPRHADATEIVVEGIFRKYLRNLVEGCDRSIILKYSPAGLVYGEDETMTSAAGKLDDGKAKVVEVKALTPSFYSRLLHYTQDVVDALELEQESATISISNLDPLARLRLAPLLPKQTLNPLEHPRFWAIQNLRSLPSPIESLESSASPSVETKTPEPAAEKHSLPAQISPLEQFLLAHCSVQDQGEYASKVLKLFISEHIAFGWMEVLDLEILLVRTRVVWVVAGWLSKIHQTA